jgi:hypothetical protein
MKSKASSVLIFTVTLILSITLILVSPGLSKPKPKSELITFVGDLDGSQEVVGCCPNAGPIPEYTMTFSEVFEPVFTPDTYPGHIFMNFFGAGKNKQSYLVRFWWPDGINAYFIEIIGGVIKRDRKAKILTVTFVNEPCKISINDFFSSTIPVNFTLTRDL